MYEVVLLNFIKAELGLSFQIHKEETSALIERGRSTCELWKVPGWLLYGCLIKEMTLIADRMRVVGLFVSFTNCQWNVMALSVAFSVFNC